MAPTISRSATITRLRPVIIRTPQERRALSRLRRKMEKSVEHILAVLDELAGDPDLEDGGDDEDGQDGEPDLGWTATTRQQGQNWQGGGHLANFCHDNELDTADAEPSLGAPENHTGAVWHLPDGRFVHATQTRWARGGGDDREDDGDDLEPEHFL